MKLNKDERFFLDTLINSIENSVEISPIYVLPFFKELVECIIPCERKLDERANAINKIILENQKLSQISVNKVTEKYNEYAFINHKKALQKSSIYNIMTKELDYRYIKTTIKSSKLLSNEYIKYCFFFIKAIIRSLRLGLNIIFVDESGFKTKNNHFYSWRNKNQEFYNLIEDNKKTNLLIGVTKDKVVKYKLIEEETNSINFLQFMKELDDQMSLEEKTKTVIVMDNCSCHQTPSLFKFYDDNKLKILFNVPYKSTFNMVENVFRLIKNITYKKLYKNIIELKKDLKIIIEGDNVVKSLSKLYKETLVIYKNYIDSNNYINLNNL